MKKHCSLLKYSCLKLLITKLDTFSRQYYPVILICPVQTITKPVRTPAIIQPELQTNPSLGSPMFLPAAATPRANCGRSQRPTGPQYANPSGPGGPSDPATAVHHSQQPSGKALYD